MDDTGKLRKVSGRLFSESSATLRCCSLFFYPVLCVNRALHGQPAAELTPMLKYSRLVPSHEDLALCCNGML